MEEEKRISENQEYNQAKEWLKTQGTLTHRTVIINSENEELGYESTFTSSAGEVCTRIKHTLEASVLCIFYEVYPS